MRGCGGPTPPRRCPRPCSPRIPTPRARTGCNAISAPRPHFDSGSRSWTRRRRTTWRAARQRAWRPTCAPRASRPRRAALELLDRWRDAARRVARARASVAVAEENLLRLRSLHASGAAPLLELLDARRQLDDTQARLAEARFDARLARLEAEQR